MQKKTGLFAGRIASRGSDQNRVNLTHPVRLENLLN